VTQEEIVRVFNVFRQLNDEDGEVLLMEQRDGCTSGPAGRPAAHSGPQDSLREAWDVGFMLPLSSHGWALRSFVLGASIGCAPASGDVDHSSESATFVISKSS